MYEQRSFRELVVLHLLVVAVSAAIFLWLIPIISWWWAGIAAVILYVWYRRVRN